MQVDVAMSEHHALGTVAAPAGVKKLGNRILVDFREVSLVGRDLRQQVVVVERPQPVRLRLTIQKEESLADGTKARNYSTNGRNTRSMKRKRACASSSTNASSSVPRRTFSGSRTHPAS